MARKAALGRLSAGEIEILEMLWRAGSVTLAAAHEALGKPIGYTTVQTRLNRLVEKGVVARTNQRPARYRAAVAPDDVSAHDLELLLAKVSRGRVVPLVAHLVKDRPLSSAEIAELKRLVAEAERKLNHAPRPGGPP